MCRQIIGLWNTECSVTATYGARIATTIDFCFCGLLAQKGSLSISFVISGSLTVS